MNVTITGLTNVHSYHAALWMKFYKIDLRTEI